MDAWKLTAVSVLATTACGSRSDLPLPLVTHAVDGSPSAEAPEASAADVATFDDAADSSQIYYALDVGPNTVDFSPGGPNSLGDASSCRGGTCVAATRAEVTLTTFTATGQMAGNAEGSYSLLRSDGSTVKGHFTGVICGNGTFCG